MATDLANRIETLAHWLFEARHMVVFTGAGISTDSGLPDFRGPDGIWTRREKGLPAGSCNFSVAEPNAGHYALTELQMLGKLVFLISQNVDNLHLKSGIDPERLAELHGNVMKLRCQKCDFLLDNFADMTACPLCGGALASSVVNFGDPMPRQELAAARNHARQADLFIVAGSSLVVYPAADLPRVALSAGARLAIINQGDTPLDRRANLRFQESTSEVLPAVVRRLKELMHADKMG